MKGEVQWAGFWLAGSLCMVLAVVKLALALPWSSWRVLLPLEVVLWHLNPAHSTLFERPRKPC